MLWTQCAYTQDTDIWGRDRDQRMKQLKVGGLGVRISGLDSPWHHGKWTWFSWLVSLCFSFLIYRWEYFFTPFLKPPKLWKREVVLLLLFFFFNDFFGSQIWLNCKDLLTMPDLNKTEITTKSKFWSMPGLEVSENRLYTYNGRLS